MKPKHYFALAISSIVLFVALMHLTTVLSFLGNLVSLVLPVLIGSILALFISVPMNGIQRLLGRLLHRLAPQKPFPEKQLHIASFLLTICCVLLVLVAVLTLLLPELWRSSRNLYGQLELQLPMWSTYLNSQAQTLDTAWLQELLTEINLEQTMEQLSHSINILLPNVAGALSSTVHVVMTMVFSVIISIYISLDRSRVCRHARKLISAYLKPQWAQNVLQFCRMFYSSFSSFLSGQCGEAMILGTLMFAAFSLFGLPYSSLVGVLTAVCAIIPYVGAFISCSISILLTVLQDPALAIQCALVYAVVQFIENQFIYPRVVGESVGLPPLYTLVAAMIGGKLFGILGIIFFIPLAAVLVELISTHANQRLNAGKAQ